MRGRFDFVATSGAAKMTTSGSGASGMPIGGFPTPRKLYFRQSSGLGLRERMKDRWRERPNQPTDAAIVLRHGETKTAAFGIHGATAGVMIIASGLLLLG
jgi:hypothetical protein